MQTRLFHWYKELKKKPDAKAAEEIRILEEFCLILAKKNHLPKDWSWEKAGIIANSKMFPRTFPAWSWENAAQVQILKLFPYQRPFPVVASWEKAAMTYHLIMKAAEKEKSEE